MEQNQCPLNQSDEKILKAESSKELATNGVFFQCPMINCLETLPQEEWPDKIEKYIKEQMNDDLCLQSVMLIKNCNTDQSKVMLCIACLLFHIENILLNKDLRKSCRIRLMSNLFMECISPIKGAIEFLKFVGFEKKKLMVKDQEEDFLVLEYNLNMLDFLENSIEILRSTERITLVLDRNIQVLQPIASFNKQLLPSAFFLTSDAEEKINHQKRVDGLEFIVLRTQNLKIKEPTIFKYCLIRVKFPDDLILQGTFDVNEQLSNVLNFVKESIFDEEQTFKLKLSDGHTIGYEDKHKTLSESIIIKTGILQFTFDPLNTPSENKQELPFLKIGLLSYLV